jgi:hypothetical protein
MSIIPQVPIPSIDKSPIAVLDYGIDLSLPTAKTGPWLQPGEYVVTLTVVSSDPALIVDSFGIVPNPQGLMAICMAWVSGGTLNTIPQVTFTFTTNQGRTDERSINFPIVPR